MNSLQGLNLKQSAAPLAAALGALALLWAARRAPLALPPAIVVDALGTFFAFATFAGLALAAIGRAAPAFRRALLAAGLLAIAYLTSLTPIIAAAYIGVALLSLPRRPSGAAEAPPAAAPSGRRALRELARAAGRHAGASAATLAPRALHLLPATLLAVGYGALALRGGLRYDDPAAGAALDGFVFWFVLLAAAVPLLPLDDGQRAAGAGADPRPSDALRDWPFLALRIAWLYPLARLYSLGPWNEGWSFAALLLGGGAGLWTSAAALTSDLPGRRYRLVALSLLGLGLAGFGLSTGAGLAAGCYATLAFVVMSAADREAAAGGAAQPDAPQGTGDSSPGEAPAAESMLALARSAAPWLLTPAVPFAAPFVACWMLVGAGVAGGVSLLAAVAWLAAAAGAGACVLDSSWRSAGRATLIASAASLLLGVLAPVVVLALIQPAIEQLQGGLSVFGDVNIWPWVGLAAVDSARRGVTALPSIAVAALMLILSALAYLALRLRDELGAGDGAAGGPGAAHQETGARSEGRARPRAVLSLLRDEVPWLGARARREEAPGDDR
nr:MAG: hypothetical protein DIU80_04040 [Chloroflexota bacterium]